MKISHYLLAGLAVLGFTIILAHGNPSQKTKSEILIRNNYSNKSMIESIIIIKYPRIVIAI
ncbi:hypothetical protein Bcop_1417 [Bacteroides coprosuis DSM 18011]|uniref:Uncharacterized protein n=1 Tax=Bacteroides coprosuis DSM 18011 TaxID=679937 RepID=F3ZPF5_9BACE|nr:hypothetical protein Bcop_1417 [Bacteroides coprosuis DSM 18011]